MILWNVLLTKKIIDKSKKEQCNEWSSLRHDRSDKFQLYGITLWVRRLD